jgi:hypothetical protein
LWNKKRKAEQRAKDRANIMIYKPTPGKTVSMGTLCREIEKKTLPLTGVVTDKGMVKFQMTGRSHVLYDPAKDSFKRHRGGTITKPAWRKKLCMDQRNDFYNVLKVPGPLNVWVEARPQALYIVGAHASHQDFVKLHPKAVYFDRISKLLQVDVPYRKNDGKATIYRYAPTSFNCRRLRAFQQALNAVNIKFRRSTLDEHDESEFWFE